MHPALVAAARAGDRGVGGRLEGGDARAGVDGRRCPRAPGPGHAPRPGDLDPRRGRGRRHPAGLIRPCRHPSPTPRRGSSSPRTARRSRCSPRARGRPLVARPRHDRGPHHVAGRRPGARDALAPSTPSTGAGRGASGDGPPAAYAIERELEDLVAVGRGRRGRAEPAAGRRRRALAAAAGSRSGRSLRTAAIRADRVPTSRTDTRPARAASIRGSTRASATDLAAGDNDGMLARFMSEAIGMPPAALAAFRADPIWPLRAAAAPTILRELDTAEGIRRPASMCSPRCGSPSCRSGSARSPAVPDRRRGPRRAPRGRPARDHRWCPARRPTTAIPTTFIARVEAFLTPDAGDRRTNIDAMTEPLPAVDKPPVLPRPRGRHRRRDGARRSSTASAAGCCTAATASAISSSTAPTPPSRTCSGPATGTRTRSSRPAAIPAP